MFSDSKAWTRIHLEIKCWLRIWSPKKWHLLFYAPVLRIRSRIRIHMFLGLLDSDPDPSVRGVDPDPDPSIVKQIVRLSREFR
jgi:hypothetical protein